MFSDEETAAAIVALLLVKKNKEKRKRFVWVKPWLERSTNLGLYETLVQELRFEDESEYKKLPRMTPQDFDEILELMQGDISETKINIPDSIPANIKLAAIIRFLATDDIYTNLPYQFLVNAITLSKFIPGK